MSKHTVMIIDDEPNILTSLRQTLELGGYRALMARSGAEGLEQAAKEGPDLVLLDLAMPEMDGLEVLGRLRQQSADLPVVMISGNATVEHAVQATKMGASDFLEKPLSPEKILVTVKNALKLARLEQENQELRRRAADQYEMVGDSPAMRRVFDTIARVAPSGGRVLVTGESGTGKELVARAIHRLSQRADQPLVTVNCAAIPKELIESELFGHEKGAFTGAAQLQKGKFELAHQGTLFLDEIGDMSAGAQAKVLRALQEGEIERLGRQQAIKVDVRVIAATNKDLAAEIEAGTFREDLFYRLNVVPIQLLPLREHKEDIPALCQRFIAAYCGKENIPPRSIEQGAVSLLIQHHWPGNVRELKNVMERLVILSSGQSIGEIDVQLCLPDVKKVSDGYKKGVSLKEMMTSAERELILSALADNEGHVANTAAALQVERSHLYKKMRALGINHRG